MDGRVVVQPAGRLEDAGERGVGAGLDRNAPAVEIVDERGEHLAVEMGDEEIGRGALPRRREPRDRLLVGSDRVAGAVAGEEQLQAEGRIGPLPERHMDDLLDRLVGWLGNRGIVGGRWGIARRGGVLDPLGKRRHSPPHLLGVNRRAEIHPAGRHLPLLDERPAHLAAGLERLRLEGRLFLRGDRPRVASQRQAERGSGLHEPGVEEGVPALPGSKRGGEIGEHPLQAARGGCGGKRVTQFARSSGGAVVHGDLGEWERG